MEQYKIINSELMNQVQKQRIRIGELVKLELLLKRQLFEERQSRLIDIQHNELKLKAALRTLMETLNINININADTDTSKIFDESKNSENSSSKRFSCNQVCSELRRSSALVRRSVTLSPNSTRRSCSLRQNVKSPRESEKDLNEIEESIKEIEPRRLNELEGHLASPDTLQCVPPDLQASPVLEFAESSDQISDKGGRYMSSIIEEDSEEGAISVSSSTSESLSLEESQFPLRDLTNKTPNPKNTKKCSTLQNLSGSNMRETVLLTQHSLPKEQTAPCVIPKVVVTRPEPKHGKVTRGRISRSDSDTKEQRVEPVRQAPRQSSPMPSCQFLNSDSVRSPRLSQLDFTNFNDIAERPTDSSTPRPTNTRSKRPNKKKPKSSTDTIADATIVPEQSEDGSLSSRPSRRCRPLSLKEPNRRAKLRSE